MLRQTLSLALFLLVAFTLLAEEPVHDPVAADGALTIEHAAWVPAVSSSGDADVLLTALSFDGTFAASSDGDAQFGGCYTACYPQLDSVCAPGQVAEITATGPTNSCALVDFRCVDRCSGPIVRCNQFGRDCFDTF